MEGGAIVFAKLWKQFRLEVKLAYKGGQASNNSDLDRFSTLEDTV